MFIKSLIERTIIASRGLLTWVMVGYPFVLLFLIVLGIALFRQVSWLHIWIILILGTTLMIAEMLNYAIEKLCDVVTTRKDNRIKDIKDICAGSVLVAGLALAIVGLWIII